MSTPLIFNGSNKSQPVHYQQKQVQEKKETRPPQTNLYDNLPFSKEKLEQMKPFFENPIVSSYLKEGIWKVMGTADDFNMYRNAIGELTKTVLTTHVPKFEGILEIGAGYQSLVDELPKNVQKKIHISDVTQEIVNFHKSSKQGHTILQLNAIQLTSKIKPKTYNCIIMRDFLSILNKKDLSTTCQQAASVLKPGGLIIHFQYRVPFSVEMIKRYSNPYILFFPSEETAKEETLSGLYAVNKEEFLKKLNALSDHEPQKKVLKAYLEQYPKKEGEVFAYTLAKTTPEVAPRILAHLIKLNCASTKKLENQKIYESTTLDALKQNNFEIVKSESMESTLLLDRKEAHLNYNFFSLDKGVRQEEFLHPPYSHDIVKEKAIAHVIVARLK